MTRKQGSCDLPQLHVSTKLLWSLQIQFNHFDCTNQNSTILTVVESAKPTCYDTPAAHCEHKVQNAVQYVLSTAQCHTDGVHFEENCIFVINRCHWGQNSCITLPHWQITSFYTENLVLFKSWPACPVGQSESLASHSESVSQSNEPSRQMGL